jgi:hypothetical protein
MTFDGPSLNCPALGESASRVRKIDFSGSATSMSRGAPVRFCSDSGATTRRGAARRDNDPLLTLTVYHEVTAINISVDGRRFVDRSRVLSRPAARLGDCNRRAARSVNAFQLTAARRFQGRTQRPTLREFGHRW